MAIKYGSRITLSMSLTFFRNKNQLSPQVNPRFCQLDLGMTGEVNVGEEIESVLNLIPLPLHVRIGIINISL